MVAIVVEPGGDLAVAEAGRIELTLPHREHGNADQVATLQGRIAGDVDALDRHRAVESDPPQRAVRLVAEVAAGALVERDRERSAAMRPQAHEREATLQVPAEHA